MPYDDLHCSYDKVTRCVELGIDVLVDDSPVNLENAREQGIVGATIVHPWNAELVERDGIIGARDWRELKGLLEPVLSRTRTG
jgi:5'(3')-deoxyribonucleotidase